MRARANSFAYVKMFCTFIDTLTLTVLMAVRSTEAQKKQHTTNRNPLLDSFTLEQKRQEKPEYCSNGNQKYANSVRTKLESDQHRKANFDLSYKNSNTVLLNPDYGRYNCLFYVHKNTEFDKKSKLLLPTPCDAYPG